MDRKRIHFQSHPRFCFFLCVCLLLFPPIILTILSCTCSRITGCPGEAIRVPRQSTRSTKRLSWRNTGSRWRCSKPSSLKRNPVEAQEAGWVEAVGALTLQVVEALILQAVGEPTPQGVVPLPRMTAGTQCPSLKTDLLTPLALAKSLR